MRRRITNPTLHAHDLEGVITAWKAAGKPLEK